MVANQIECSSLEQRCAINLRKIYRTICNVYGEIFFLVRNVYKWFKHGFSNSSLSQKDCP